MKYLLIASFFVFTATAQSPIVGTEVELSPATKQEIAQKAAPIIRQVFEEQGCKEANVNIGLHFEDLNLLVSVQCTDEDVENAPEKAQMR